MSFTVLKTSFLATLQDVGRIAYAAQGLSQSGVMDEQAYHWANYLLGNRCGAAVVEITYGAFSVRANTDTVIAVTGADLDLYINGKAASNWRSFAVKKGDTLHWRKPKQGVRAYFAVKNGFTNKPFFGSVAVNKREGIGCALAIHDELLCEPHQAQAIRSCPVEFIPNYSGTVLLRLLPCYQFDEFSAQQKALFLGQVYSVSPANDRVAYRLEGEAMSMRNRQRISEGMSYGSVEIATDGLPIVLLKDAPTIGGYPKIGTVFSLDLPQLVQRQAGAKVRFELIDIEQTQRERQRFNAFFGRL